MSASNRAHARRTDPIESHDAAACASQNLTESRQAVLDVIRAQSEPVTDADLVVIYGAECRLGRVPFQADSGVRTRRSELARIGLVERAGTYEPGYGRKHAQWRAAA